MPCVIYTQECTMVGSILGRLLTRPREQCTHSLMQESLKLLIHISVSPRFKCCASDARTIGVLGGVSSDGLHEVCDIQVRTSSPGG